MNKTAVTVMRAGHVTVMRAGQSISLRRTLGRIFISVSLVAIHSNVIVASHRRGNPDFWGSLLGRPRSSSAYTPSKPCILEQTTLFYSSLLASTPFPKKDFGSTGAGRVSQVDSFAPPSRTIEFLEKTVLQSAHALCVNRITRSLSRLYLYEEANRSSKGKEKVKNCVPHEHQICWRLSLRPYRSCVSP